jgi:hypothetical protein
MRTILFPIGGGEPEIRVNIRALEPNQSKGDLTLAWSVGKLYMYAIKCDVSLSVLSHHSRTLFPSLTHSEEKWNTLR